MLIVYKIKKFYKLYKKTNKAPLFKSIEIETINRCNGTCPFCPVNKNNESREYKKMDEELFIKIIGQLTDMNYKGSISLFSNNEPFLDTRIIKFAKIVKEKLPQAHLKIFTNGSLLTLEKFKEIMKYLDEMVIDNYSDEMIKPENIVLIENYCKRNKVVGDKLTIAMRKANEVLTTRGGEAPNKKIKKTLKISCILPFHQFIVRPDGKVSLCCNDALGKMTLGDCSKNTILEIWNSNEFMEVRKKVYESRKNISICSKCDTIYY